MNIFSKLRELMRPTPKSPEDIAAEVASKQLRDQLETVRLSQRSAAGENYQSGNGPGL